MTWTSTAKIFNDLNKFLLTSGGGASMHLMVQLRDAHVSRDDFLKRLQLPHGSNAAPLIGAGPTATMQRWHCRAAARTGLFLSQICQVAPVPSVAARATRTVLGRQLDIG